MYGKQVQWFPGHMARALREMKESLKKVDLLIELADARIPHASRNPEISRLRGNKPYVLVLTKADLADPTQTANWIRAYASEGISAIPLDALTHKGLRELVPTCREAASDRLERAEAKGRIGRPVRAMVVGIPNVGKSTLINALAGRRAAKAEDRPGVTRSPQWIRLPGLELLDMPGVLWPKIVSKRDQLILAATGAIRDEILSVEEIAIQSFALLLESRPELLAARFKLDDEVCRHALDPDDRTLPGALPLAVGECFEEAARKRGCLLSGGRLDLLRFSQLFLDELRGGKIGRITLESPEK